MGMRGLALLSLACLFAAGACSPSPEPAAEAPASRPNLYACDGCEAAEERDAADLDWRVRLPPQAEPGDPLVLSGRVLQPDGEASASGVVLYFHQTNAAGLYQSVESTARGGRNDGMIEGWLATDARGRYEVETVRPGPYPEASLPAHVHVYVKEPGRRPYYLDDFVFEGDPFVDAAYREAQELRGGSGILTLSREADGTWRGARDLILEP